MPFCQLTKFKHGIEAFALIGEGRAVRVLETETSLIFRGGDARADVAVTIPKCSPQGVSYSRTEREADVAAGEAVEVAVLNGLNHVASVLRGARVVDWRPSLVELVFVEGLGPALNVIGMIFQAIQLPHFPIGTSLNRPSFSETGRISSRLFGRMGRAGLKISPDAIWQLTGGVWEIKDSQGLALRVATWPNPTATS